MQKMGIQGGLNSDIKSNNSWYETCGARKVTILKISPTKSQKHLEGDFVKFSALNQDL